MAFDTQKIWMSPQLPVLQSVGVKVLEQLRQPATAHRELALILRNDSRLADDFLSVANSPLCVLSSPALSVEQALSALGVAKSVSLTLSLLLAKIFQIECSETQNATPMNSIDVALRREGDNQWRRAIIKAIAAELLGRHIMAGTECEYFWAGLSLDLGQLAVLRTNPQEYFRIQNRTREGQLPSGELEKTELGVTSTELGGQMVEQWGFPISVVRAVQLQHASVKQLQDLSSQPEHKLCRILGLASAVGDYLCGEQQAIARFRIRELTSELVPLCEAEIEILFETINRQFEVIAPLFSGERKLPLPDSLPSLAELKARTIEQLTSLAGRSADLEGRANRGQSGPVSELERRGFPKDSLNSAVQTNRDALTSVFTQEYFDAMLVKESRRCCQVAAPLGVAVVRIDNFNQLREKLGSRIADVVLRHIGGVLNELMRSADTIGRRDEQFSILASTPTSKGMQKLADRVRARVAGERLVWEGRVIPITVSVGASLALPGRLDFDIGQKVVQTAQKAADEAAFGEGNNIYFSSLIDEVELNRLFMANQMRFSRWLVAEGVLDIPRVAKALLKFNQRPLRMGELAMRQELLSQIQVQQVLTEQEESNARFGDIAVRRTYLSEDQLQGLLILQQEDPILVASLFLELSLLEPQRLKNLLQDYFKIVPWAAPLYPAAGRG